MKRQTLSLGLAAASAAISALSLSPAPSQAAGYTKLESMTDRCSGEVIVLPGYSNSMETPGSVLLKRDRSGNTPYSGYMKVNSRTIRWYCHSSSKLSILDPGTWRIKTPIVDKDCKDIPNLLTFCRPTLSLSLKNSAKSGWFAERSRCPSGTTHIRSRLGSSRLLRIQCYKATVGGGLKGPRPPINDTPFNRK